MAPLAVTESTVMTNEPDKTVNRQQLSARDRSLPGQVTGRLRRVLDAMVWEAASRKEAAEKAGMSDHSVRQALKRPHVMAYYNSECEVPRQSGRAKRLHRLDELAAQDTNKNAAVAAIKAAEGIADEQAARRVVPFAGLVVRIISRDPPPSEPRTINNDSLPIEARPVVSPGEAPSPKPAAPITNSAERPVGAQRR